MVQSRRTTRSTIALVAVLLLAAPSAALAIAGDFGQPPTSPEAAGSSPFSVVAGNLNGDANTDLAIANASSSNVTILLGDGTGDFTAAGTSPEAAGSGPGPVAAANLHRDANTDLAIANGTSNNVTILLGDGTGNFTAAGTSPEAAGTAPGAVVAANLNGDSNLDLAVANQNSSDVTILLGDGTGNFTAAASSPEAT